LRQHSPSYHHFPISPTRSTTRYCVLSLGTPYHR
jgi:hypothetical protein